MKREYVPPRPRETNVFSLRDWEYPLFNRQQDRKHIVRVISGGRMPTVGRKVIIMQAVRTKKTAFRVGVVTRVASIGIVKQGLALDGVRMWDRDALTFAIREGAADIQDLIGLWSRRYHGHIGLTLIEWKDVGHAG